MCKVHFQGKQLCHICLSVGEYSKTYFCHMLDVSAVAGHHAMPAPLLFFITKQNVETQNRQGLLETCLALRYRFIEGAGSESVNASLKL